MTSPEPLAAHVAWINALATAMADTTTAASATDDDTEEQQ